MKRIILTMSFIFAVSSCLLAQHIIQFQNNESPKDIITLKLPAKITFRLYNSENSNALLLGHDNNNLVLGYKPSGNAYDSATLAQVKAIKHNKSLSRREKRAEIKEAEYSDTVEVPFYALKMLRYKITDEPPRAKLEVALASFGASFNAALMGVTVFLYDMRHPERDESYGKIIGVNSSAVALTTALVYAQRVVIDTRICPKEWHILY